MPPSEFYVRVQHGTLSLPPPRTPECAVSRSWTRGLLSFTFWRCYLPLNDEPEGITGGFAPPTPKAITMLTRSGDTPAELDVQSMKREDGTPDLAPLAGKKLKTDDHAALIDELEGILKVRITILFLLVGLGTDRERAGAADGESTGIGGYLRAGHECGVWQRGIRVDERRAGGVRRGDVGGAGER